MGSGLERAFTLIAGDRQRLDETAEVGRTLIGDLPGAGMLILDGQLRIVRAEGDVHSRLRVDHTVGRKVADVVPASAWEILGPCFRAALVGETQAFRYEAVIEPTVHWLRATPIRNSADVVGVLVVTQDITAQARSEAHPAEGGRLEHSVLEALAEGVLVVDTGGRLLHANAAACTTLGVDLSLGSSDPEWWLPHAPRQTEGSPLGFGRAVLETGQGVRDVEAEIDRPDGTTVALSINYLPRRDDAGAITGLVVSFRDHHRRQEHRSLRDSQARLKEAYEVARLSSWEWTPGTDEVQIFHALPGSDQAPGARASLDTLFGGLDDAAHRVREELRAIVAGNRDESFLRYALENPDGIKWIDMRSHAVRDESGALVCIRGTSQDVTGPRLAEREAAAARDFFQATLDSLPAHIVVLDERGEIVMTNQAWDDFAVANGAAADDKSLSNYLTACDNAVGEPLAAESAAGLRAILSGAATEFCLEYPCHGPAVNRWFTMRAARFEGPGERRVVVAHDNVTQRREAEARATTQAALLDEVDVAVVATDNSGLVSHWARGAERQFGWTAEEALGRDVREMMCPVDPADLEPVFVALGQTGHWEGEAVVVRKDGTTFPAYIRDRLMQDADGQPAGMIAVSVDMTERVATDAALRATRNYLAAVTNSIGEGLFTLDTDGRVTYLNEAAERLLGWPSDDLVGKLMHDVTHRRPDGSEFPVEDCPIFAARRDGRTMRVDDDTFVRSNGHHLSVAYTAAPFETDDGVSGCVVVFKDIAERKEQQEALLRDAEKLHWIGRIREALAGDQFVLYAQPIIDLASGDVVQRELLLRLREPDGKIVGPGAYLHIAEQYGLISDIDRWVIERGTQIAATGVAVEINISGSSIGDPDLLAHIERCIRDSGADPTTLVFEITETAVVQDEAAARVFATHLRGLGCKLALDDFGTGYGGFTHLKQLPMDYLKIDIEFVRDLMTDPASRHVVEAVVALARAFKLQTVAEGVEDQRTLELLNELGVDFAQGYHISRPAPLETTGQTRIEGSA